MIRQLRPQGGIDHVLLQILRLGIYELVELGLPDHVINDHVDMARKLVRPEAAKVANGEQPGLDLKCGCGIHLAKGQFCCMIIPLTPLMLVARHCERSVIGEGPHENEVGSTAEAHLMC